MIGAGPAGWRRRWRSPPRASRSSIAAPAYDPARAGGRSAHDGAAAAQRRTAEKSGRLASLRGAERARSRACASSMIAAALLRAPEVLFRAEELGLASFGANIANAALNAALDASRRAASALALAADTRRHQGRARRRRACQPRAGRRRMRWRRRLVVAADGRNSMSRAAAGIATRTWDYGQAAIAASFRHTRAAWRHHHRAASARGPLTTVPLPGDASSLVWVEEPARGAPPRRPRRCRRSWPSLERACRACWARSATSAPRAIYPLSGLSAERMGAKSRRPGRRSRARHSADRRARAQPRPARCGGAGRVRRPTRACAAQDIGGPQTLAAYHARARRPTCSAAHGLGRSAQPLAADRIFCPCRRCAASGCICSPTSAPLRRLVMRGGLSAGRRPCPRLMQPDALP